MAIPDEAAGSRYHDALDRTGAEVDRLVGVTRSLAAASGAQRAAADVGHLVLGISSEELAGLLTAALIRLAGLPDEGRA
jgi:hypothetical protein